MLLLWHVVQVSHAPRDIMVDYKPERELEFSSTKDNWISSTHTDLDDGSWKVPLEAHIMFVLTNLYHYPQA
jgi:hypothetical protein